MPTLYETLGGESAMQLAVEIFYRKMLTDERVSHFFDDTDMDAQIAKQKAFLTFACGGPNQYTGKDMRQAHAHLIEKGLNDSHVDIVIQHLGDTLTELQANPAAIEQVKALAESVRADVLSR